VNLTNVPVPLTGQGGLRPDSLKCKVEAHQGYWTIAYLSPGRHEQKVCKLWDTEVELRDVLELYARTQRSDVFQQFNNVNYSRINVGDAIVCVIGDEIILTKPNGATTRFREPNLIPYLVEQFGYTPDLVQQVIG
jgi:hypothetical protein